MSAAIGVLATVAVMVGGLWFIRYARDRWFNRDAFLPYDIRAKDMDSAVQEHEVQRWVDKNGPDQ